MQVELVTQKRTKDTIQMTIASIIFAASTFSILFLAMGRHQLIAVMFGVLGLLMVVAIGIMSERKARKDMLQHKENWSLIENTYGVELTPEGRISFLRAYSDIDVRVNVPGQDEQFLGKLKVSKKKVAKLEISNATIAPAQKFIEKVSN